MIHEGQAGISCTDCGYAEIVNTKRMSVHLEKDLEWKDGDPICPGCGTLLTFEDYIRDL